MSIQVVVMMTLKSMHLRAAVVVMQKQLVLIHQASIPALEMIKLKLMLAPMVLTPMPGACVIAHWIQVLVMTTLKLMPLQTPLFGILPTGLKTAPSIQVVVMTA
ncbi:hypothetical protein PMIT1327_00785 [Prochlorococcus marinus str. MIT 1327]|nr:hypothetical protein PMIT1327_00785 [Prochlorococcus marinus str. MIT 1327]